MTTTTHPAEYDTSEYPVEDGEVVESDAHYIQGASLVMPLKLYFASRPDVFVGGNIAFRYEKGNPRYFGPDVLVAFSVRPRKERSSYVLWIEGVPPAVIIELTSEATHKQDTDEKPRDYAALGVREYYLFDPLGEFLTPRLQGYHLNAQGVYNRVPGEEIDSPSLGLRLVVHDNMLRLLDPATGTLLPTLEDAQAALRQAEAARRKEEVARRKEEAARRKEEAARRAAEAEIARLRAELARRGAPEAEES